MSKNTKNITFFLAAFFGVFFPVFAFAVSAPPPRLEVMFESTPLFENANFIPYDEVSRFVKVTNHTGSDQKIIVEAINYSSCPLFGSCFAKKLHLKITSGAETHFNKPLSEFYGAGSISLGDIAAGEMKQYDFRVVFEGGVDDNDYQKSTTKFDLLVGFAGEDGGSTSGEGGSAGGGGGSVVLPGLQINNEAVVGVSESTASISWNTNYESWGHVIYGIDTSTPYTLNLALPNFGYPSSAPNDPSVPGHPEVSPKTGNHTVNLSGLTPGATYRYRAVSHASPPTVGYEHTFTVPLNANANDGNNVSGESDVRGGSSEYPDENPGLVLGAMKTNGDDEKNSPKDAPQNDISLVDDEKNNIGTDKGFSAVPGVFSQKNFMWWVLFLIILFIFWFVLKRKRDL
jgi:hypothetical protein